MKCTFFKTHLLQDVIAEVLFSSFSFSKTNEEIRTGKRNK